MPKLRQVPRVFPRKHADGTIVYHWKPSATLRKAGFVNVELGTDRAAAFARADDLNAQVEAWRKGEQPAADAARAIAIPRLVRFSELVRRFRASEDFPTNKATANEYNVRLRQLQTWADGAGDLAVTAIDKAMVRDLREGLMKGSSLWVASSILRILRLLLNWAKAEEIVSVNVMDGIKITTPPSRRTRMDESPREAIIAAADALGLDDVALAVELGFWTIQRQADVLAFNRFKWHELEGLERAGNERALLVDPAGRVMSFRFEQQKTGVWIEAPVPPAFHDRIRARMAKSATGWLFHDDLDPALPMPNWKFQRRFRAARIKARDDAIANEQDELAAELDKVLFRDLRRTGMVFYRSMGAKLPWITALSGHSVIGKKTILDTYMPADAESAVRCVETGLAGLAARAERARTEDGGA